MASVNKKFVVGNGLQVGDSGLIVDTTSGSTGIGSTQPSSGLDVTGNVYTSGVTTSFLGFSGNLTGVAVTAAVTGNLTGDVSGNINSSGVSTVAFFQATNIRASGIITATNGFSGNLTGGVTGDILGNLTGNVTGDVQAGFVTATKSFDGNLNSSGVSTAAFLQATNVNAVGVITASSFEGDGSQLTGLLTGVNEVGVGTVAFLKSTTIDATGIITAASFSGDGSALTGLLTGVNETGIGTVAFLQSTTVNVSAGATFGGDVKVDSLGVGVDASGTTGEIRASDDITAFFSDERLKENIEGIESALDKVCELHGVLYNFNEVAYEYGYTSKDRKVGVLAQEVQKVLPEAVARAPFDTAYDEDGNEYSRSGEDYLTVRYEKIVPLLIEAIKELRSKIDSDK